MSILARVGAVCTGVVAMLSEMFVSKTRWQPCRPPPRSYTLRVVVGTIDIVLYYTCAIHTIVVGI